jgi:hypothetical protein
VILQNLNQTFEFAIRIFEIEIINIVKLCDSLFQFMAEKGRDGGFLGWGNVAVGVLLFLFLKSFPHPRSIETNLVLVFDDKIGV